MLETERAQPGFVDLAPQPKNRRDGTGDALTRLLAVLQGKGFCPTPGFGPNSGYTADDYSDGGGTPHKYPHTPGGDLTAATEGCTPLDLTPSGEEDSPSSSPISASSGSSASSSAAASPIASGSWTAVDQVAIDQMDVLDVDSSGAVELVLSPVLGRNGTEQPANGGEVEEASLHDDEYDCASGELRDVATTTETPTIREGEADPATPEAEKQQGEGKETGSIAGGEEERDVASGNALELRRVPAVTVGKGEGTQQVEGRHHGSAKERNWAATAAFVVAVIAVLLRGMGPLQSLINDVSRRA